MISVAPAGRSGVTFGEISRQCAENGAFKTIEISKLIQGRLI
jgi:hypothetical protein